MKVQFNVREREVERQREKQWKKNITRTLFGRHGLHIVYLLSMRTLQSATKTVLTFCQLIINAAWFFAQATTCSATANVDNIPNITNSLCVCTKLFFPSLLAFRYNYSIAINIGIYGRAFLLIAQNAQLFCRFIDILQQLYAALKRFSIFKWLRIG